MCPNSSLYNICSMCANTIANRHKTSIRLYKSKIQFTSLLTKTQELTARSVTQWQHKKYALCFGLEKRKNPSGKPRRRW
jgi:hypothetical protein